MTDTQTQPKTLPQWSTFGKMSTAKVTYRGREFVLTEAQEAAAQALAKGEFVQMARRSGKNLVRQRVLDILAEGKGKKAASGEGASKKGSQTVYTLLKFEGDPGTEQKIDVLGTFSTKTGAKGAANSDFVTASLIAGVDVEADDFTDLADRWVNDKSNSNTPDIAVGDTFVAYDITGRTLRK